MRVLIAEDSLIFKRVLESKLKEEGYELTVCCNGAEAWEALQTPNPPRLAILDWMMPEMNGIEVCRKVRRRLERPYVYIIMLTAQEGSKNIVTGFEAGADDYLTKPFEFHELSARLKAGKRILDLQAETKRQEMALRENNDELTKALDELRKAQALLLRQEKLASIGTLSAGVAHEILNPLNIIGTIIQVMQMDELPEDIIKNLDEIMVQIQRATKITNNLRMFAHQKASVMAPVNVADLFDKTATMIEHDLKLENISINRKYDENAPAIYADEDQLAQVFLNLLTNARDAMKGRQENQITIKTKTLENGVEIYFSDNGPGIPQNVIKQIFDPFFTTKDPDKGTGLGLSLAHSIIEKHMGTLDVESREGEGTTFVITLPVEREEQ